MLDRQKTVASVVLDHSECAEVFQRNRIDFCCRGNVSLEEAARARGIDPKSLVDELTAAIAARRGAIQGDPRDLSSPRLVAYIVAKHHEYLRRALPYVRGLAVKVARVHGEHNPNLRELDAALAELSDMLLEHLDEEETTLFPQLTAPGASPRLLAPQLREMTEEHREVARLLERVRAAADDFKVPDWACNSYRTLFSELTQLERDVFTHVHLENHVLAPRFLPA